jgi:hypothetical protein
MRALRNLAVSSYLADPEELTAREREAEIQEKIEETQREQQEISDAWDAWSDMNSCLHYLDPPSEIVEHWDHIRGFLESKAGVAVATLNELLADQEALLK